MNPNTEEARRLADEASDAACRLGDVADNMNALTNEKAGALMGRIGSAIGMLRSLADEVERLKAENEAMTLVIKATTEALKGNYN